MKKTPPLFLNLNSTIVDNSNNREYIIKSLLGHGAFAQVFLTESNGMKFALKTIKLSELKSDKLKEKLESELLIHARLDHPNIVKMYGSFRTADFAFLVLQYCRNTSLDMVLKRKKIFSEAEIRKFTSEILAALEYLHSLGIVHRDLKLGNLFLDSEENLKIGDFGLAAVILEGQKKKTVCGTPNYIAPEILFDKVNGHSFEADYWSLGVIIYTLAVGTPPFQKKEVKQIYRMIEKNHYVFPTNLDLSPSLVELISNILITDPMKRHTLEEIKSSNFLLGINQAEFIKTTPIPNTNPTLTSTNCLSSKVTDQTKEGKCANTYQHPQRSNQTNGSSQSKGSNGCAFKRILLNLETGNYKVTEPDVDYVQFSIPLSKVSGIGYILKSGNYGIYFNNHSTILYNEQIKKIVFISVTRIEGNKKILKKEEFYNGEIPESLVDPFKKLKYFISTFKSENYKFESLKESFVVKVKRMKDGLVYLLWNGMVVLDFNCELKVLFFNEGKSVYCLKGCEIAELNREILNECVSVLKLF